MATNINDIAAISGVSNATVSRAFREPEKVSAKTREKVLAVAASLGFTPNSLAGNFKQGKAKKIVVLVPDITNPYFSPIVQAIEKVAHQRGYSVLLGDTGDIREREEEYAKMVLAKQADGIIINSQRVPIDVNPLSNPLPIVSTSEVVDDEDIYKVTVDNIAIGEMATSHLLELGHKKIAVVCGTKGLKSCEQRLQGYKNALSKAGIEYDPELVHYTKYSVETGAEAAKNIITQSKAITAIFSFGDLLSIGILHTLNQLNYSVPEQISLISVDDIALAKYCHPPLTTVAQPKARIGESCAHMLIDLIENKAPEEKLKVLEHELILRNSTSAPG